MIKYIVIWETGSKYTKHQLRTMTYSYYLIVLMQYSLLIPVNVRYICEAIIEQLYANGKFRKTACIDSIWHNEWNLVAVSTQG